jgi:hypothetical protein
LAESVCGTARKSTLTSRSISQKQPIANY